MMRLSRVRHLFGEIFGLDLRSLALLRIGLGLLLLLDLAGRLPGASAHYSDRGVLPRDALRGFEQGWIPSLHSLGGEAGFQAALMAAASVFALSFALGFGTRLSGIASWILLISIHTRNPMLLHGGDAVLRLLLFWSLFLPLGARYSLDAALTGGREKPPDRTASAGSVALLMQIAYIYLFSAALKSPDHWWHRADAAYYALSIDWLAKPLGQGLLAYPELLRAMTRATYLLEWVLPLFLFAPFSVSRVRIALVACFAGFHAGLWLTMELGLFPAVCAVAWLAVIPAAGWNFLRRQVETRAAGAARLSRRLTPKLAGRPLFSGPLRFMRSPVRPGLYSQLFAGLVLVYVTAWNVRTLDHARYARYFPAELDRFGFLLRVDQVWNLFAPSPTREDGWFVIPGKLADGSQVDLFRAETGRPQVPARLFHARPGSAAATFPGIRWRKYMMNLWLKRNAPHRLHYARYLCRKWNSQHRGPRRLRTFEIVFMKEYTLPGNRSRAAERISLRKHDCFEGDRRPP